MPPPTGPQLHPSLATPPSAAAPISVTASWPIPETYVTAGRHKLLVEVAATALLLVVAGIMLLVLTRDAFGILAHLSGMPATFVLLVLAVLVSILLIVFALVRTGHFLYEMHPVGRPLTALWTILFLAMALQDGTPGLLWGLVIVLAVLTAGLYLSPACKTAFAAREMQTERPSTIEFSMQVLGFQILIAAVWLVGLLPVLGSVSDMNEMGEFIGQGGIGTRFAFGWVLFLVGVVGAFIGRNHVGNRQVTGRLVLSGLAAVSIIGLWLAAVAAVDQIPGSTMGMASVLLPTVALWLAIIGPLWIGQTAARWFNVAPVATFSSTPNT